MGDHNHRTWISLKKIKEDPRKHRWAGEQIGDGGTLGAPFPSVGIRDYDFRAGLPALGGHHSRAV